MYYNPQSNEIIEDNELKCLLNASFPENEEQVMDWYLIHDDVPKINPNETAIPDKIALKNGKYVQTYRIEKFDQSTKPVSNLTIEDRISAIESGLIELAELLAKERTTQ